MAGVDLVEACRQPIDDRIGKAEVATQAPSVDVVIELAKMRSNSPGHAVGRVEAGEDEDGSPFAHTSSRQHGVEQRGGRIFDRDARDLQEGQRKGRFGQSRRRIGAVISCCLEVVHSSPNRRR